jgi:hypothetical protein
MSMGQVLCAGMIAAGMLLFFGFARRKPRTA